MQLFYNSKIKANDKTFSFDKNESRHIIKVFRKKIHDKIFISNGLGCIFEAEINSENQHKCEVSILNVSVENPKDFKIHLAVAPTKLNDRFEWFIEKATEIGVDIITPIFCTNSERKIIKEGRFQKILESAAKQSLRAHFPVLKKAISFKEFIVSKLASLGFIGYVETQCINSNLQSFFLKIFTASFMSSMLDIPVDIKVCFFLFATSFKNILSTIIAEAIL